jgi:hypothetical protein
LLRLAGFDARVRNTHSGRIADLNSRRRERVLSGDVLDSSEDGSRLSSVKEPQAAASSRSVEIRVTECRHTLVQSVRLAVPRNHPVFVAGRFPVPSICTTASRKKLILAIME